jgi:hypothetical protein
LIGRQLYPLLAGAGFKSVSVSPLRNDAIAAGLIDAASFDAGINALHRTTDSDGVFSYTFFKAIARAPF